MSQATEAVIFNGLPLLLLAAAYAVVTGAVLPVLWRDRARAHALDWATVLVFPGVATAAGIFGVLVVDERRPFGGHTWLSLAAVVAALIPAMLLILRWRERAVAVGGVGRSLEAAERISARDRELAAVAQISNALARAHDETEASQPLVRQVAELLGVGFAAVAVVEEGEQARGVYAEADGEPAEWWADVRVDLRNEPSGIASAVFEASPVTVYDVSSSPLVSPRLAGAVGAQSGVWIPMISEERVIGVLVVAATDAPRTFAADELSILQAIASESALAIDRIRSAAALAEALAREQRVGEIVRAVRRELTPADIVRVAEDELRRALALHDVDLWIEHGEVQVRVDRARC